MTQPACHALCARLLDVAAAAKTPPSYAIAAEYITSLLGACASYCLAIWVFAHAKPIRPGFEFANTWANVWVCAAGCLLVFFQWAPVVFSLPADSFCTPVSSARLAAPHEFDIEGQPCALADYFPGGSHGRVYREHFPLDSDLDAWAVSTFDELGYADCVAMQSEGLRNWQLDRRIGGV
ncbi:hypothetical protein FA95DRAFT_1573778 [Auriscalpium vulgare]|uniref:Uncharacterized protein n=1 Tax=Auriscalpium vulgare TaxID=40419 RepID=A0ACB8RMZ5_9AGAM|nr:hypothetical protein FA95DRAFT_1573778 [Auriscalpium vulgare]